MWNSWFSSKYSAPWVRMTAIQLWAQPNEPKVLVDYQKEHFRRWDQDCLDSIQESLLENMGVALHSNGIQSSNGLLLTLIDKSISSCFPFFYFDIFHKEQILVCFRLGKFPLLELYHRIEKVYNLVSFVVQHVPTCTRLEVPKGNHQDQMHRKFSQSFQIWTSFLLQNKP